MEENPSFLSLICLAASIYLYFKRTYFYDKIFAGVVKKKHEAHLADLANGKLHKPYLGGHQHTYAMSSESVKISQKYFNLALVCVFAFAFFTGFVGGNFIVVCVVLFINSATLLKWHDNERINYHAFKAQNQPTEPAKPKRTEFGSATFNDVPIEYDVEKEKANEKVDNNLVFLGWTALLKTNHKKHIITFAPSRSGKGTCLIMPNLLFPFDNSYVVLDIKGENATVSARRQKELGKDVVIIDPWGVQKNIGATHGIEPMAFNPLSILEGLNDEQIFEECTSIAELIAPIKDTKDTFWINRARVLIRGLLLAHIKLETPANWSLMTVYKTLRLGNVDLINYLNACAEIELASDDANQFKDYEQDNKTFLSILSSAQDATEFIRNTSKGGVSFNPKQINEKPTVIYVCIPEKAIENNYQWLRLVVGLCIRSISENVKNKKVDRTVFLLDEAHYLGNMPEIRKALATSATYGICIWQFYQDIGQLQAAYGDYWHSIMNVGVQQFYKISDLNTQKYISELLGDYTLELTNASTNSTGDKSYSDSITKARLLTPDQVGKVDRIITRIDGKNYLLFGIPYYDENFKFDYDKNPLV